MEEREFLLMLPKNGEDINRKPIIKVSEIEKTLFSQRLDIGNDISSVPVIDMQLTTEDKGPGYLLNFDKDKIFIKLEIEKGMDYELATSLMTPGLEFDIDIIKVVANQEIKLDIEEEP